LCIDELHRYIAPATYPFSLRYRFPITAETFMVTAASSLQSSSEAQFQAQALVARAREMIPALKERSAPATDERCLPEQTIREMQEAGFFRVLQPKRHGGFELDPQVFVEIQMTLAEGCMSTAWVYGVLGVHPFQLALFDARAQREVWDSNDATLVSSSYQPVGTVERVEGGFRLSGRWGFSSGCDHCEWVLLGAVIPPAEPGAPPDMRTFLLPRSDYRIVHDWTVFGLQATGSHGIIVDKAFVPEYRTHRAVDGFLCKSTRQRYTACPGRRSSCARSPQRRSARCRVRWMRSNTSPPSAFPPTQERPRNWSRRCSTLLRELSPRSMR
jgi:hypothetical protein